jgi:endo-1,4-beta-D-glucanase Y
MSLRCAGSLAGVLLVSSLWLGCSGKAPPDTGDDAGVGEPDADVNAPDAAPGTPDAEPGAPDAEPGSPDARPGTPDAMPPPPPPPDAAPPSNCGDGSGAAAVPFASHPHPYASGTIKPAHSQAQLDSAVRGFYDTWKDLYVGDGCGSGRYLVLTGMPDSKTVSEAHGYGMVIAAYMAGHDPEAKTIFDGMYKYYLAHQSANTPFLMAWSQNQSCANNQGPDSATDGDLDIAYALLLADKQWGSGGAINYRAAADKIMDAIRAGEVDASAHWILLGDWAAPGDDQYDATRTSDFMPGHIASYAAATGDGDWTTLLDSEYAMVAKLQQQFAGGTGLLPDFVVHPNTPSPAPGGFLEGASDGRYGYNACRDPWRLGVHAITTGDSRAKTAAGKLSDWIADDTGGDPGDIHAGYLLNGNAASGSDYTDMCFVAPFGVAAMVGSSHQAWLNAVWDFTVGEGPEGYYQDTVKMLSMIAMSGNWWTPESIDCD